jgi:competence protein ComEA
VRDVENDMPRGEAERVAVRVRELVGASGAPVLGDPGVLPRRASVRMWDRLAARVPVRVDPGRRSALAIGVAVLVAALVTGLWLAADRPRPLAVSAAPPAPVGALVGPSSAAAVSAPSAAVDVPTASASPSAEVVVDVAGKVRRPGIYQLPPGSRVDDAVRAAGGPRSGVSTVSLNLAEPLRDGEQIVVGRAGTAAPLGGGVAGTAPDGATSSAATIVDLNTATLEQLETLPGVGPVLGQHILDWRDAHGQFTSVSQLQEVSGIGDVRLAQLSPLVTV